MLNTDYRSYFSAEEYRFLQETREFMRSEIAPYAERRIEIQVFPSGGNHFSSTGVRTLTFNISGTAHADFSTLMKMNVKNDSTTHALLPNTPDASCLISELRLLIGGVGIERIGTSGSSYARAAETSRACFLCLRSCERWYRP